MKKIIPFLLIPFLGSAQIPSGYYDTTNGLSGYALKTELQKIASSKYISWNYADLGSFYSTTDVDRYYENNGSLLDIYSEIPSGPDAYEYNFTQIGGGSAEGTGWNREHAMPQSTYSSNYPMYSDLFFVIPTDARINQLRSNYPYGKVGSTIFYTFTNGSRIGNCAIPNSTYTGRVYEPIDEFKGDVARMLLYFAMRYEGKFGSFTYNTTTVPSTDRNPMNGTEEKTFEDWYVQMLLSWHALDPVSQKEIDRNNYVYNIQKNRNPFIDHPEWVSMIWNQTPDAVAPQAPSNLIVTKNSAYFVDLQWQASPDTDVIGYELYQDGILIGKTKGTKISIDKLAPSTSYNFSIKAYDNGYLTSPFSNVVSTTTLTTDNYAKDLMISKYIEGSSNNKALEIVNLTGHDVNLQGYRIATQFKSATNYYFGERLELEGKIAHGERFVVINPNANLSCFTTLDAKFISASPAATFSGYNYVELNFMNSTVDAVGNKGVDNDHGNKSLYRLSSVTNPTIAFNSSEWQSYGTDYCTGLGVQLSTAEIMDLPQYTLYPNPTSDILYLKGKTHIEHIEIFDISGRKVTQILKPKSNQVDVRNLQKGVYMIKIDTQVLKFIKN